MGGERPVLLGDHPRLLEDARVSHLDEGGRRQPDALASTPPCIRLSAQRRVVDVLQQCAEHARKVALVIQHRLAGVDIRKPTVVRHVGRGDEVTQPQLDWVHPELAGDEVDIRSRTNVGSYGPVRG